MPWITVADIRHGDRIAPSPDQPQWEVVSLSAIAGGRSINFVGGVRADEANDLRVWRFGSAINPDEAVS